VVTPVDAPLAALEAACRALLQPHVPEGVQLRFERPREAAFGDLSCNVAMTLARSLKKPPLAIAEQIVQAIGTPHSELVREVRAAPPGFLNFYVNHEVFAALVLASVRTRGPEYGRTAVTAVRRVVVEHTSVNPNKPWHIGHVRNAVLGDVLGRLFRFAGHTMEIQNYIDDTGKQVADMIFGLQYLGLLDVQGQVAAPPEQKFDHFVGDAYVRINTLVREGVVSKEAMEAGSMAFMHAREAGEYRDLVHRVVFAQLATAWRLGIFYDLLIWEGDIVQAHLFDEAMERLRTSRHVFLQNEGRHSGCLVIDMGAFLPPGAGETGVDHPTERVLIRSNGLPTYTAKDIAYHMWKYALLQRDLRYALDVVQPNGEELWTTSQAGEERPHLPPDELINLIDVRQSLPQQVVKAALQVTGYTQEAESHHHLAYGVVSPRGGRFSGREGTEHSADSVLDLVAEAQYSRALAKSAERGVTVPDDELRATSEVVAIGALRYLMCRFDPLRDIEFTVEDVIDERGTTGLYVQYAYARVQSIFRKGGYLQDEAPRIAATPWDGADAGLLTHPHERALVMLLARFPAVVTLVVDSLSVHALADYAHELSEQFNLFYEACPILRSDVPEDLRLARLALAAATAQTLRNVAGLLGLELPERL
jgi:arginyl-tRNA synthetase